MVAVQQCISGLGSSAHRIRPYEKPTPACQRRWRRRTLRFAAMSGKTRFFILAGTALIAMLVGAASYTLYRLWPRPQPAQATVMFKPEDMETYKAASAALAAFKARPQCDGEDAKAVTAKLAE